MKMLKWSVLRATLMGLALLLDSAIVAAQACPSSVIMIIELWPPGGPSDSLVRPVMEKLAIALGQSVIIDSKPGANGTLGTAFMAKVAPEVLHAGVIPCRPEGAARS